MSPHRHPIEWRRGHELHTRHSVHPSGRPVLHCDLETPPLNRAFTHDDWNSAGKGSGEHRAAIIPSGVTQLSESGYEVIVESGAGLAAHFTDEEYRHSGAIIADDSEALYRQSEIILKVRAPEPEEASLIRPESTLIGLCLLFGGAFGKGDSGTKTQDEGDFYAGKVKYATADDLALLLDSARNVVMVPGYGLAVAQAQHAVKELASQLESRGAKVRYAIHPVAGRMPGHMNVLLAEAEIPYDHLKDMDAINPELPQADVAIVLGANDVVNPAATDRDRKQALPSQRVKIRNAAMATTIL